MKLKILAMTKPEYPLEEALNAFPAGSLTAYGYMVRNIFADTRTLAEYLARIEQGGYAHDPAPMHQRYYEWVMCAYI